MSSVEDLYQEIILEHNKRPHNFGPLAGATHSADGHNPLCGDEIHVALRIRGNQLEEVRFEGQGCAISRASASMMTEAVAGKPLEEVRATIERVIGALRGQGNELDFEREGDLASLVGVRKFPARIKCATLAWHALEGALRGKGTVSTETND
jgi:nitrogen fixation NifU-like protein